LLESGDRDGWCGQVLHFELYGGVNMPRAECEIVPVFVELEVAVPRLMPASR